MTKRRTELRNLAIGRSKTLHAMAVSIERLLGAGRLVELLRGTAALLDLLVKELDS